ncbi:MAG TPA: EAL domain-containing protein [Acetobacteraceae bacterium]|nr:EAL domain-containing protein [Acetobacteraceae bacterium]
MPPLRRAASAWLPLALIVAIGVALSVYASFRTAQYDRVQARAAFERQALGEIGALKVKIDASFGEVIALAALYETRHDVGRDEFQRFARTILDYDPSIQALEWAQTVDGRERGNVERRLSAEYGLGLHFTQRDHGKLVTAGERSWYVPITYIAPMLGNEAALAFDLASEATRRTALEQAERTGQPTASGRIRPVQQPDDYSFLLFRPVFAPGPSRHMAGVVFGLFRISGIVGSVADATDGVGHDRLVLLDQSAPAAERLLYPRDPGGNLDDLLAGQGLSSDISVAGRTWRILVLPPDDSGMAGWDQGGLAIANAMVLVGNIAIYLVLGIRLWGTVEREHDSLDKLLRQNRERLALATRSARIGIWDWDLATGKLVWDARMYELYGIREQDFSGAYQAWVASLHPDDRERGDAAVTAAIRGADDFEIEFRVIWPNGEVHDIEAHAVVQIGPDGRATRMTGVNWDITERKHATDTIRIQADRFQTMLSTTSDGFFILDHGGKFLAANDAYCALVGFRREELLKLTIKDIEAVETAELAASHMRTIVSAGFDRFESQHRHKDGTAVDIEGSVSFQRETGQYLCFARDVTRHKQATAALQASETRYRDLFDSSRDAIIVLDADSQELLSANASAVAMFGARNERELLARHPWDYSPSRQPDGSRSAERAREMITAAVRAGSHMFEWLHTRTDGTEFPADVRLSVVARGDKKLLYSTIRDITDQKRADQQIARMADYDGLTGLVNRQVFVRTLEQRIVRARRDGSMFAVLYLDLDHFKDINDTLGHPAGDRLLRIIAERLRAKVRASDTVARFGGDEFAILLNDVAEAANALTVTNRVLQSAGSLPASLEGDAAANAASASETIVSALAEPIIIDANRIYSGATVGIAVYGPDTPDAETILAHADVALYRAKAEQRGTFRFFSDAMGAEVQARVNLGAELRDGLAAGQFFLEYQPQVDMESGRILGLEALVRWRHPNLGVVPPGGFVPEAERNGLIVPLGRWIVHEACRQARQWLDSGVDPPLIAVNLSGVQFKRPLELEATIAASVAEFGVPPRSLELELTESVLMEASLGHNDLLLRLRNAGHRIAVDDFGTGYSSLDYLRRYPVDRIKIAQTFIKDIGTDPGNDTIVRAALSLARELNIEVVIEGVETPHQVELLKGWGGRIAQGYYFSKPLAVTEVIPVLRIGCVLLADASTAAIAA